MRNPRFSILKGLAIILVVTSHAGAPDWLLRAIFMVHVPAFFLCAGYFFNTCYLSDERTFLWKRVKGLYLPYVRWSLFFLVVHNLLFTLGILSETYGNAAGGVLHPYNWHQFCQNFWSIIVNMSGHNQFLGGAFWFFRAFFLANIAFLVLFKLLTKSGTFKDETRVGWGVTVIALVATAWKVSEEFNLTGISQGGYRELMGVALMGIGFLFSRYEQVLKADWRTALAALIVLVVSAIFCPTSLAPKPSFSEFLSLPLPAIAGFVLLAYAAYWLNKLDGKYAFVKRGFCYIGDHSLYIFAFHLLAFKLVSAIAVGYYSLPWEAVGGHPFVMQTKGNVLFFILYIVAGVALPLLWMIGYAKVRQNVRFVQNEVCRGALLGGQIAVKTLLRLIVLIWYAILSFIMGFWKSVKDIIAASSPQDEEN